MLVYPDYFSETMSMNTAYPNFKTFLVFILTCFTANLFADVLIKPDGYSSLPYENFQKITLDEIQKNKTSLWLNIFDKSKTKFIISSEYKHSNDDVSFQAKTTDKKGYINATLGKNSIFGQMHYGGFHYIITTEKAGSFIVKLPQTGLDYNRCGFNHKEQKLNKLQNTDSITKSVKGEITVIDFFFLYSQDIVDRYPGELLQTRLNQYFSISNQVFANTNVNLAVRLVGSELTDYKPYNSNVEALYDLRNTLAGNSVLGLETVKQSREKYGADMVVLMRPHNIETRGNCGVAFYPTTNEQQTAYDPSYGVHLMSDGMSSWSVCTDQLMIHELGHNLGAAHNNTPAEYRFIPGAAGFAKLGQFATVMGSFGTGRPERFLELDVFSNPDVQCGGQACGTIADFNNAKVITQLKDVVANYQPSISSLPIPEITRNTPDNDGDGISDWDDAFPFDAQESIDTDNDGVGDETDAFPEDASEQYDTDNDGIGNNQDEDPDGDGFIGSEDFYPLDANENADSDSDGVGDNADSFADNFFEQIDNDSDGIGDNQDTDDDNDTFIDNSEQQDLLVISIGNNKILRFDAETGASGGIEVLSNDGLLTFQSDLTYRADEQILFYTSSSAVKRVDLSSREALGVVLPAYPRTEFQAYHDNALYTGFTTSIEELVGESRIATTTINRDLTNIFRGSIPYRSWRRWNFDNFITVVDMLYVRNSGEMYFLDNANRILKSISRTTEVEILNQDSINSPYAMAINPELNRLFVSNQGSNNIVTINPETGDFENILADLTSLGYSKPTGLAVTKNNVLLAAVSDQNTILKFNAETGEFLGELVSANGLDKPHKMILVPKLNDRFNNDETKVIRPNAGLWYNPATSGRGFDIEVFGNFLSVIWYTFDEQGLPIWYISSGELVGFNYTGEFKKTRLNSDGSYSQQIVGEISLEFEDERRAQANWQIGEAQGSEAIQWLTWSSEEETDNYTGLWGRPDGPGWGVSIATIGPTSVIVPYIYDASGEPRWLISNPVHNSSPLSVSLKAVFSDTLCPSCSGISSSTKIFAGTMVLDVSKNKTWQSQIQFPSPLSGEWILEDTELKLFSSFPTRPR